ncbi:hypothetical protein C8J56DRAFT_935354 [Mycena floridula]|nr:hypothetical protein C8J56DRAFT_935354 [Mycena floridula]
MRPLKELPLDVIDNILLSAPSFADLNSCIRVSKTFYTVFQAHPISTIRAVAYNVAGPALRQAIRAARHELADDVLDNNSADSDEISPITPEEARLIVRYAETAAELENIFSIRHKDRTSRASKLGSLESWRFRRAIYRLIMYANIFHFGAFVSSVRLHEEEDDSLEGVLERLLRAERLKRKAFLYDFSTEELLELYTASVFLLEVANWAVMASDTSHNDYTEGALAAGPAYVLESYQNKRFDDILHYIDDDQLTEEDQEIEGYLEGYISAPISQIMTARKVPSSWPTDHWKSILENVVGEHEACAKCSKADGLKLFGESNWHYMYGASPSLRGRRLRDLLKGELKKTLTTINYLRALESTIPDFYPTMMKELFEVKSSAYAAWNKEDWLCQNCIKIFISGNLYLWLLYRQGKDGIVINEDCWDGYDCRIQVQKQNHAQQLNHFCAPVRLPS